MKIAYLKDHKNKKRGDFETMSRADFLKLYNQEIATSKIDWDRKHAKAFEKEQSDAIKKREAEAAARREEKEKEKAEAKKKKRGRPKKETATNKLAESRETTDKND